MSISSILRATELELLDKTSLEREDVGIHEDGRPKPQFGRVYVSIHPTSWSVGQPPVATGLYEKFSIGCTVTRRLQGTPQKDILSNLFVEELEGLENLLRSINRLIHLSYILINRANEFLDEARDWTVEPLTWLETTMPPRIEGSEWLWSTEETPRAALVATSTFVGAGRDQTISLVE